MDATFYVVDRDTQPFEHLDGSFKPRRELAILTKNVKPGDLVRDVIQIYADSEKVIARSDLDDHLNLVSIGFRVAWGDQYEEGAEKIVTARYLRAIVEGVDDVDDNGVWVGRHFGWAVSPNTSGEIRDTIFDSRN